MGWTSYRASHYKNRKIDRKAECDAYFLEGLNEGYYEVLKSSMVGTTYYAAVKPLKRYCGEEVVDIPREEQCIFAAIFLTSTDMKSYFNFSYKPMDETICPYKDDCPRGILDLLTPTENELANKWRKQCYENIKAKRNPESLNNLPAGSVINVVMPFDTKLYREGDVVKLTKGYFFKSNRTCWYSPRARFTAGLMKQLDGHYEVLKRGGTE